MTSDLFQTLSLGMKHDLITLIEDETNYPTVEIISETLIRKFDIDSRLSLLWGKLLLCYRKLNIGRFINFLNVQEKIISQNKDDSPIPVKKVVEPSEIIPNDLPLEKPESPSHKLGDQQKNIPDIPGILLFNTIHPFCTNNTFRNFDQFNYAVLQLFKLLNVPKYNMTNWSSETLKKWTSEFRSFCEPLFDVYVNNDISCGDLIDLWTTHHSKLIELMENTLTPPLLPLSPEPIPNSPDHERKSKTRSFSEVTKTNVHLFKRLQKQETSLVPPPIKLYHHVIRSARPLQTIPKPLKNCYYKDTTKGCEIDIPSNIQFLSDKFGGTYDNDYLEVLFHIHDHDLDKVVQQCVYQLAHSYMNNLSKTTNIEKVTFILIQC